MGLNSVELKIVFVIKNNCMYKTVFSFKLYEIKEEIITVINNEIIKLKHYFIVPNRKKRNWMKNGIKSPVLRKKPMTLRN